MRDVLFRVQKTAPTFSTIGATPVPFENFFGLWKKTSDNPKKRLSASTFTIIGNQKYTMMPLWLSFFTDSEQTKGSNKSTLMDGLVFEGVSIAKIDDDIASTSDFVVVGDHDDREPTIVEFAQYIENFVTCFLIEVASWFIR